MDFPVSINFFTSVLLIISTVIGLVIFRGKKDKVLMALIVIAQIIFLGVILGYIRNISNLRMILSSITIGLTILYLLIRQDRRKDYLYYFIHFLSIIQFLHIFNIIT